MATCFVIALPVNAAFNSVLRLSTTFGCRHLAIEHDLSNQALLWLDSARKTAPHVLSSAVA